MNTLNTLSVYRRSGVLLLVWWAALVWVAPTLAVGNLPAAQPGVQSVTSVASQARPQDTLLQYYNALGRRDYRMAYRLWTQNGAGSGKSYAQFRAGFAQTAATYVRITGPVQTEGAAGSLFATVPVVVTARLHSGQRQIFTGQYVLRKNNTGTGDPVTWNWHLYQGLLRQQ